MDELIAEVEKVNAELAGKLRAAVLSEIDAHKGSASTAEKKLRAAEKERDKLRADLEAASKGGDESAKAALAERDAAQAALEKATADLASTKLRTKIERKLGITDEKWAARAVDAFLADYAEGVELDDKGAVVGVDKALEAFKAAEPLWFAPAAEQPRAPTSQRAGSAPAPARPAGGKAPDTEREKIDKAKAEMQARNAARQPANRKKG